MRILLIHPQNYLQRHSTGIYGRGLRYAPLTMPTLKALVPPDLATVQIVDEMVEEIDFDTSADLVGITAITGTATRAYEIADRFRARGITVVMGGVHPTMCTQESLGHADAVVKGYAERTWPRLVRDFAADRRLVPVYEDHEPFDARLIVSPDRSGIRRRDYLGWCTVEMSRGCSNKCEFCISHRFHRSYICRPIGDVIDEIRRLPSKIIFFLDPNLIGDREHAKEFFSELTRLRKWWLGCASLDVVEDPELLDLMAGSGCRGLLMGFESVRPETLAAANKTRNIGKQYAEVVDALHDRGILVQACFVFGFDTDDVGVFPEAADYIANARFDLPQISIYTPFPGTPVYERMEREGRILTRDWSRYNGQNVVFRPMQMTPEELERGTDQVRKRAYAWGPLARRMLVKPLWVKPLVVMSYLGFRLYQYRIAGLSSAWTSSSK